MSSTISQ